METKASTRKERRPSYHFYAYDEALKKLREAKEAVSAFVGVYDEESRK